MNKPSRYFVTRSIDGAILGKDGRWMKQFAHAGDIKFYSSVGRATKHGFDKIPESMHKPELGNMHSVGTAHAVYHDESVNVCGHIIGPNGKRVMNRGTNNHLEIDTETITPEALWVHLVLHNVRPTYADAIVKHCQANEVTK